MKFFLVTSLLLMACGSLSHANSCVLQKEEKKAGAFKVISSSEAFAKCGKQGGSQFYGNRGRIKIKGCVVEFEINGTPEPVRVFLPEAECKLAPGSFKKGQIESVKNECCGVTARFGRYGPFCVERPDLKFVVEPTDNEKMCLTGVEWKWVRKK